MKTKLWMCGQLMGEWNKDGSVWGFQGVFDSEEKAIVACRTDKYFITPIELNVNLPHEICDVDGSYYPLETENIKKEV